MFAHRSSKTLRSDRARRSPQNRRTAKCVRLASLRSRASRDYGKVPKSPQYFLCTSGHAARRTRSGAARRRLRLVKLQRCVTFGPCPYVAHTPAAICWSTQTRPQTRCPVPTPSRPRQAAGSSPPTSTAFRIQRPAWPAVDSWSSAPAIKEIPRPRRPSTRPLVGRQGHDLNYARAAVSCDEQDGRSAGGPKTNRTPRMADLAGKSPASLVCMPNSRNAGCSRPRIRLP
jgi:hypothetical protein